MKLLALLYLLLASFKHCRCSLFSDVFTELDEGGGDVDRVKQAKLKTIFIKFEDTLEKRIEKWKKTHTNGRPLQFDMSDKLMLVLKNIPLMHRENFVKKLNKFLRKVSKGRKMKGRSELRKNKVLPVLLEKLKLLPAKKISTSEVDVMKRKLKNHAKKWMQPSFMKFKETTKNITEQLKGEKVLENWIGKHFKKPHHLSTEDTNQQSDILQTLNSVMNSGEGKSVEYQVKEDGVGKTLMNGVIEERMELPWQKNTPLNKLSQKQKNEYLEAERKWEIKLTQETQRLLDKLQPADAYIVPDLPIFDGVPSQDKLQLLTTGNNEWKKYVKLQKANGRGKVHTKNAKIPREHPKEANKSQDRKSFEEELAEEESEWFGVEKSVMEKMMKLKKYAKKQLRD